MDKLNSLTKDDMFSDRNVVRLVIETKPEIPQDEKDAFLDGLATALHISTKDINLISINPVAPDSETSSKPLPPGRHS